MRKTVSDTETVEAIKVMVADSITISRILFSLLLLVFSRNSHPFVVLYFLCGITDVLDGFVARKLHTESEKGATLDSIADLIFAVIYAVRILPFLSVPYWILIWTAIIAVIKVSGIVIVSRKKKRMTVEHSFGNRLTGLLLFLLPLSVYIADVKYGATVVCIAATVGVFEQYDGEKLSVAKITFGAEPKNCEVYEFILKHYYSLRFSPAVAAVVKETKRNPKKLQRDIKKSLEKTGIGTKSQQALKLQQKQNKQNRKAKSREEKQAEAARQFELKQQKKKEKRRGR